jgi:uncharacterized protein
MLLAHNADPCLQAADGETALHRAAGAGHLELCKLLVAAGSGSVLEVRDCFGGTPLTRAVSANNLAVVELLHTQHGSDLFVQQRSGVTLMHAAALADPPLIEYLIRNGLDVNAATSTAVTPVCVAVEENNVAAVQTLLEHGASTAVVNNDGDSLLTLATKLGNASIIDVILRHSKQPAVGVNARSATGVTVLHLAVMNDHTEVAAVLLRYGAALNACNANRLAPLLAAVMFASAQCIQLLLDAGAELQRLVQLCCILLQ